MRRRDEEPHAVARNESAFEQQQFGGMHNGLAAHAQMFCQVAARWQHVARLENTSAYVLLYAEGNLFKQRGACVIDIYIDGDVAFVFHLDSLFLFVLDNFC